jgi:hypothetical protein
VQLFIQPCTPCRRRRGVTADGPGAALRRRAACCTGAGRLKSTGPILPHFSVCVGERPFARLAGPSANGRPFVVCV